MKLIDKNAVDQFFSLHKKYVATIQAFTKIAIISMFSQG